MEYHKTKDILHVQKLFGHKNIQNTLIYIDLESKLFNSASEGFTTRVAHNVGEERALMFVQIKRERNKERTGQGVM
jgi:hypothetical protein